MKVSGFVANVSGGVAADVLTECKARAVRGKLADVYVQLHGNVPETIARNSAAFAKWKEELGPLGVRVFAWIVNTGDVSADAELVDRLADEHDPHGFVLNAEEPTKWRDLSHVLEAAVAHGPVIFSTTGYPAISPQDFRHVTTYGARVEWQGYDGPGVNDKDPAVLVKTSVDVDRVQIATDSVAWWYRVHFDNLLAKRGQIVKRWGWVQAIAYHATGYVELREGSNRWLVKADPHEYGFLISGGRRVFNKRTLRDVGRLYGVTRYEQVGVSLSVERDQTPQSLAALASRARMPNARIRPIAVYTLENCSDAQFDAIASAA